MSMSALQGIALALMIAALPLASVGTTQDATWANVAAVAAVGLGGLIPPVLRFARSDEDDADDDGEASADATEEES